MLGRLSSIITNELLHGRKAVVVRCEEICMFGGLIRQRVVCQSVQLDGREVIRDRALGPSLTARHMVSGPPPVLLQVRCLHVPLEVRVLRNGLHGPGPPFPPGRRSGAAMSP
ncbi:60S ribosomal protein L16-A-like [Panicum hallii]|uniref:60S ribosomal protein L16-A-like n=1 Tax=Panicum hallii TaxID=206008 RepID=UPI000DF4D46A|nr:60S ribosomal protein L16-A-like [Panicum hallii]